MALDLLIYGYFPEGGTSFVGNISPFKDPPAYAGLPRDGRCMDLLSDPKRIFPPNRNMLTGHAQIGAYSPLLDKDYYELTKDFGQLDDSFGRTKLKDEALKEKRPLLDYLNVKYIVTDRELNDFLLLSKEEGKNFYLNEDASGREFSFEESSSSFSEIRVVQNSPLEAVIHVESADGGLLLRNQIYDSGWKVSVDGKNRVLKRARFAFQGLRIPKGRHELHFVYAPDYIRIGGWLHGLGILLAAGGIAIFLIKNFQRS